MSWKIASLLGAAMAAAVAPVQAQTTAGASGDAVVSPVTVTGQRRVPTELGSRSSDCEATARDPSFRALKATGAAPLSYTGTRMPRNPNLNQAAVPAGTPLPEVLSLKQRLRMRGQPLLSPTAQVLASDPTATLLEAGPLRRENAGQEAGVALENDSLEVAIIDCQSNNYAGGSGPSGPASAGPAFAGPNDGPSGDEWEGARSRWDKSYRASIIDAGGRADIKANDTTLPMGFALFDQGRYEESLDWFKKAHARLVDGDGGDEAALMIGKIYLLALGDRSDPVEAVAWLKKAAHARFDPWYHMPLFDPAQPERNTAIGEACVILANIYRDGYGAVAKDPAQRRRYLELAVEVGHVPAAKPLGDIYYYGLDAPKDLRKAFRHYMQAAKFAYAPAALAVAQMYEAGEVDGRPDKLKALGWYQQAARLNEPEALYSLAVAYDRGEGVAADPQRALALYKQAALTGDPAARTALGTYYYEGDILPKDLALARRWFEAAAVAGDADGMVNLAAMMAKGEGGAVDRVHGWAWLRIAETQRHPGAGAVRRVLERGMTSEEQSAATKLLATSAS